MKSEKYNRSVSLHCPTCGGGMFEYDQGVDETIELVKCASCGRETTKDELIRENSENISEHAKEIGNEFVKDAADELRKSLKKAFRGSKYIKIK
jgi:uncharacterized Zn finger protein (UPF0148 family)